MRVVTFAGLLALLVAGCLGVSMPVQPMTAGLSEAFVGAGGSALLARARASVQAGSVDETMRGALAASTAPRDRHAARLLAAVDAPAPTPGDAQAPEDLGDAPRIKMGTSLPPESAQPSPVRPAPVPSPIVTRASGAAPPPAAAPKPAKPRPRLERLAVARGRHGASLSLKGSGGLVVGVASQPASGIVRLVMDADASTAALRARPKITGARVTGIRRTGKSVFVTLTLDDGWSLRGIVKTRGGARVDLRSPA